MADENLNAGRLSVAVAFTDLLDMQAAAIAEGAKETGEIAEEILQRVCKQLAAAPPPPPSQESAKTFAAAALYCSQARLEAEAAGGEIVLILRALEAAAG